MKGLTQTEAAAIYDAGKERVVEMLMMLSAKLAKIEQQVTVLEGRLNQNSQNSHWPPSRDIDKKPAPQSQRKKTGKASGGQPGHEGTRLEMVAEPKHVKEHWPEVCAGCGKGLGQKHAAGYAKRQVHDIPPIEIEVTEHRAIQVCCGGCGTISQGTFPTEVSQDVQYGSGIAALATYANVHQLLPLDRTTELIEDICGRRISEGTLVNMLNTCAEKLVSVEAEIKAGVIASETVNFDETGLRVVKTGYWLHVSSTPGLTLYWVDPKRGQKAHVQMGVLPEFRGNAIHDRYDAYLHWPDCTHGFCGAHILRDLTGIEELTSQNWATQTKTLLCEMNDAVGLAKSNGQTQLAPDCLSAFEARYDQWVRRGLQSNRKPVKEPDKPGRPRASPARNLAEALHDHKDKVILFVRNFAVPFDNNLAERDLRMMKVKQKVSGCFRSIGGARTFATIRSYISTARKQGHRAIDAVRAVFDNRKIVLNFAE